MEYRMPLKDTRSTAALRIVRDRPSAVSVNVLGGGVGMGEGCD
jgi:hypothetical protein